jgi:hypothetical protein
VPVAGVIMLGVPRVVLPDKTPTAPTLILSKAFLVADDQKITDETILRQIGHSAV